MKVECENCGKVFDRSPSQIGKRVYCSSDCRSKSRYENVVCTICGKSFKRLKSWAKKYEFQFCGMDCVNIHRRLKCKESNRGPVEMTDSIKTKLRDARLGKGEGKTYTKLYGKHEHRVVAEKMLGRALEKGEVVHHLDEDKRNNNPLNLMVFSSQSKHALWHKNEETNPAKNYE